MYNKKSGAYYVELKLPSHRNFESHVSCFYE